MIYEMDRFENMKKVNTWNIVLVFAVVVLAVTVALLARHSAASSGDAVMKCILTRTSIRAYQDRPVEDEKVEQLLRAAMAAPTVCCHRRPSDIERDFCTFPNNEDG